MSFTAYNVKAKRKEKMVNPRLVTKKNRGRTTFMLTAQGSQGTSLWRIISRDQAADFGKKLPPRKRKTRRRSKSKKRRSRSKKRRSKVPPRKRKTRRRKRSSSKKRKTRRRKTRRRKTRRKRGGFSFF